MDSTLLIALTVFVAMTTIAMVAQAIAMVGIARSARRAQEKMDTIMPEVSRILEGAQGALVQTNTLVAQANVRTNEILEATKAQLGRLDVVLQDAAGRARSQMEKAELVVDDAMNRTQSTVATLQRGVLSPIREVHGLLVGVRTTLSTLGKGSRPTVDHATADEEMFI